MADKEHSVKAPRLIKMRKGDKGYGFNLHGERGVVGQFISAVDDGGPAQLGGLCVGDRVVEVNDVNVEAATHSQVVAKIKESSGETTLLVVDKVTDDYLKQHNIPVTAALAGNEELKVAVLPENPRTDAKEEESNKVETVEENESKNDEEVEEAGMSIEDYLLMCNENEGKPAGKQEEVNVEVGDSQDGAPHSQPAVPLEALANVTESKPGGGQNVTVKSEVAPEPDERRTERKTKMTPPEDPPPTPPLERAEAAKEPEPEPEPKTKPAAAAEPKPAAAAEPAVKEAASVAEPLPVPSKPADSLLKKSAALPKPKRKEIKEKKGTDWASRAAIFNNL